LARESANPNSGSWYLAFVEFLDVFKPRCVRPVPPQDVGAKLVFFALHSDSKSGAFKPEIKAAYSREE
jgi:hypothetical protein